MISDVLQMISPSDLPLKKSKSDLLVIIFSIIELVLLEVSTYGNVIVVIDVIVDVDVVGMK